MTWFDVVLEPTIRNRSLRQSCAESAGEINRDANLIGFALWSDHLKTTPEINGYDINSAVPDEATKKLLDIPKSPEGH